MAVRNESFLTIEAALQRRLARVWSKYAKPKVDEILAAVRARKYSEAVAVAASLNFDAVRSARGYVEFTGTTAMLFGAATLRGARVPAKATHVAQDPSTLEVLTDAVDTFYLALEYLSGDTLSRAVIDGLVALQAEDEAKDRVQKAANKALATKINLLVMGNGRGLLDTGANLVASRLASFGFLHEAQAISVTTYQISEQLDDLICPVCERMHGRTFQVASAYGQVLDLLKTREPAALKTKAPFFPQNKKSLGRLERMSDSEVQAEGHAFPPYHPKCRGILVAVGTVKKPRIKPISEPQEFPPKPDALQVLAQGLDSRAAHMVNGQYTAERQLVHESIIEDMLKGGKAARKPKATFMGGGPGAGKSTLIESGKVTLPKGHVLLDADQVKFRLPEYELVKAERREAAAVFVHEESTDVLAKARAAAAEHRLPVAVDGVGDGGIETLQARVGVFRRAGYVKVTAEYATVDTKEALRRARIREEQTGRAVPEAAIIQGHANVSRDFPRSIEQRVWDEASLWDNSGPAPVQVVRWDGEVLTVYRADLWRNFLSKNPAAKAPDVPTVVQEVVKMADRLAPLDSLTPAGVDGAELEKVIVDVVLDRPISVSTRAGELFREQVERDVRGLRERGAVVDVPGEFPDPT